MRKCTNTQVWNCFQVESPGNVDATSAVTETVRVKLFSAKELSLHWTWNRLALALTNK